MILNNSITFEDLSIVISGGLICGMKETKQIRLDNLNALLKSRFNGNKSALARALDKDINQTRFILNPEKSGGRWIGEKQAREIEERLGIEKNWLDVEHDSHMAESAAQPTLTMNLTEEEKQILWNIRHRMTAEQGRELLEKTNEISQKNEELMSQLVGKFKATG